MPSSQEEIGQNSSTLKPAKELASWQAPERPFKRRNREFYITIVTMAAVVGLVLFLIDGWAPVILIISIVFLFYVMSTIEPGIVIYKITTNGVMVEGKLTEWANLTRFWFTHRFDSDLLVFQTLVFPGRMEFVIPLASIPAAKKALSKYLIFEEIPASTLDQLSSWFSKRLPRE